MGKYCWTKHTWLQACWTVGSKIFSWLLSGFLDHCFVHLPNYYHFVFLGRGLPVRPIWIACEFTFGSCFYLQSSQLWLKRCVVHSVSPHVDHGPGRLPHFLLGCVLGMMAYLAQWACLQRTVNILIFNLPNKVITIYQLGPVHPFQLFYI